MRTEIAVVFTAKSVDRILREGGTSAWRLDRNHARKCEYAVCTRNANAEWVEGSEAHHSAFLVGKIRDVVPCVPTPENQDAERNRYLIEFSEFARVDVPNVWKGDRNPIRYSTLGEVGIDPSGLKWEPMPVTSSGDANDAPKKKVVVQPLTLAQAKKGLALSFNIAPEAIEITIRA